MVDPCRAVSLGESRLAARKAEEAALRRFQATGWLERMVGPLGLPPQPSEREFVSCLRNGLVLCNVINKIQPGAVPKVVANQSTRLFSEMQPLPAYQYFENVRNFLVAMEGLKLPAFEACDLERDTLEAGSTAKIVDCILSMKSYLECKGYNGGSGSSWNSSRSPIVHPSVSRIHSHMISSEFPESCRHLDLSVSSGNEYILNNNPNIEDSTDLLVKMLTECMLNSKENIDQDLMNSLHNGTLDPVEAFTKILSPILQEQQLKSVIKDLSLEENTVMGNSSRSEAYKCCNRCFRKVNYCHCNLLEAQEKELRELKLVLSRTKEDVIVLHSQFQNDIRQLGAKVQELSAAALGYSLAMKENRNLYNSLQDLKGKIRVYCRIRPTFSTGVKCSIDFIGNDGSLIVMDPLKLQNDSRKVFQFDKVFGPTATQEELYKDTKALVRSVMDGYNVCIFAYGQTGSGKTHTMCGPSSGSSKSIGINHMALNDLFKISCDRKDVVKYEVRVQMVEIYNEQVRDLLAEDSSTTKLEIRTCSSNGGLNLPDAHMHPVNSTADVLNLMKLGEKNRVVSSTAINQRSSRSHSVLTVHVQGKETSGSTIHGCLHLVDLAGSERVDRSEVMGDRLKEAQYINKSLSCLGDVITALAQKSSHIPYRNSKLTQLLQGSLGGNAKTLMFAHVSPEADSYGEAISTLKFAQRVSTIELGAACLNRQSNEVRELKEQIENLKKAMVNKGGDKTENIHKQMAERTPPRPRRLSIDNLSVVTEKKIINLNDKKVPKTPVVRPKPGAQQTPVRLRRLSLEGSKCGKEQQMQNSNLQTSAPSRMRVEINIVSPQVVWNDGQDSTPTLGGGIFSADEAFNCCSPNPCGSADQTRAQKMIGRARIVPLYQPKTPEPLRKLDEVVTPNGSSVTNKSQPRSSNNDSSRKESQIRKSLKTIGKLIHGSERRNYRSHQETPSPQHGRNDNNDEKSYITVNRLQMRQSSTHVRTSGFLPSRRSSLGGNSTVSCTSETRTARTPPPIRSSPMVAKQRF